MDTEDIVTIGAVGVAAWLAYLYFQGPNSQQQNPEAGDLLAGGAGIVLATLLFL